MDSQISNTSLHDILFLSFTNQQEGYLRNANTRWIFFFLSIFCEVWLEARLVICFLSQTVGAYFFLWLKNNKIQCCDLSSRLMLFPVPPSLRLKPFTSYQFRIKATNDIGDSEYSEESEAITTLQDGKDSTKYQIFLVFKCWICILFLCALTPLIHFYWVKTSGSLKGCTSNRCL